MNLKAKQMMEKWSRRAEKNYSLAEYYRLEWKESGDKFSHEVYLDYKHRGQLCEQAAADFEELI